MLVLFICLVCMYFFLDGNYSLSEMHMHRENEKCVCIWGGSIYYTFINYIISNLFKFPQFFFFFQYSYCYDYLSL